MGSKQAKPEKTAAEQALQRRQSAELDNEIEEENRRKKSLLQSNLGVASLTRAAGGGAPLSLLSGVNFAGASQASSGSGSDRSSTPGGVSMLSAIQRARSSLPSQVQGII